MIPPIEFTTLANGRLNEHKVAVLGDLVQRTFSSCVEQELETLMTSAILYANDRGAEKKLTQEAADHALSKL